MIKRCWLFFSYPNKTKDKITLLKVFRRSQYVSQCKKSFEEALYMHRKDIANSPTMRVQSGDRFPTDCFPTPRAVRDEVVVGWMRFVSHKSPKRFQHHFSCVLTALLLLAVT